MILTCPECASRYFVDDASIGPEGRKVRCASCGASWRQSAPVEAAVEPLSFAPAAAPAFSDAAEPPVRLRPRVGADVSARLREEASEKRRTREAVAAGATWAVLGASFCVLVLGAVIFRADVVRLAPATAGAYAFARMPVNPTGLAIEAVQGGPGLQDGRSALKVSGVERNVEAHPREAEPLRITLIDKGGHSLVSQVAAPPPGAIQPGETRPFTLSFLDPPLAAASFQVEFAFDAMHPVPRKVARSTAHAAPVAAAAPATPSTELQLRGSAEAPGLPAAPTKEATPLPVNSPYALPKPAAPGHG